MGSDHLRNEVANIFVKGSRSPPLTSTEPLWHEKNHLYRCILFFLFLWRRFWRKIKPKNKYSGGIIKGGHSKTARSKGYLLPASVLEIVVLRRIYVVKQNWKKIIFLMKNTPPKRDDDMSIQNIRKINYVIGNEFLELVNECLKKV